MNLSLSYSHSDAQHAVTSRLFGRVAFDRRTGARRKLLAPMDLAKRLAVPLVGRQPAQYLLYAVVLHAGHSPDSSLCLSSGGGGKADVFDGADGGWWRLNDVM